MYESQHTFYKYEQNYSIKNYSRFQKVPKNHTKQRYLLPKQMKFAYLID